jgi:preprotein translocase subunit SecE
VVPQSAEIADRRFQPIKQASSSIGRAAVSKTAGWGFDSLLACHRLDMTDDIKTQDAGTADKAKLTIAILIAIAGVVGYYVLVNQATWLRWLAVVGSLVLAAVVVAFSRYGTEFRRFVELSRIELRKVVWPTRQETLQTTVVVFVFVAIAGLFFWALDWILAMATKFLTGQGS